MYLKEEWKENEMTPAEKFFNDNKLTPEQRQVMKTFELHKKYGMEAQRMDEIFGSVSGRFNSQKPNFTVEPKSAFEPNDETFRERYSGKFDLADMEARIFAQMSATEKDRLGTLKDEYFNDTVHSASAQTCAENDDHMKHKDIRDFLHHYSNGPSTFGEVIYGHKQPSPKFAEGGKLHMSMSGRIHTNEPIIRPIRVVNPLGLTHGCPFCGTWDEEEEQAILETLNDAKTAIVNWNVVCSCGAMGPDADSREEAISRWNNIEEVRDGK